VGPDNGVCGARCHSKQDGWGWLLANLGFHAASSKAKDSWGSMDGVFPAIGVSSVPLAYGLGTGKLLSGSHSLFS